MDFLLINPKTISTTTILGGNVDIDKYRYCVSNVQVMVLEPLLGTELYNKILTDAEANVLSGLYAELYAKIIKYILINESLAEYIEVAPYMVANGGIFKLTPENKEVVSKSEVNILSSKYHSLAQVYILKFEKWIRKNTISEYKTYQEEVNAQKIKTSLGWYL